MIQTGGQKSSDLQINLKGEIRIACLNWLSQIIETLKMTMSIKEV